MFNEEEVLNLPTKLKASDRMRSHLLIPYRDILMNEDADWVAYAPFSEVLSWCKMTKELNSE